MAVQSGAIGASFYAKGHYWKRKIGSMTNEEFNKLTPQQLDMMIAKDIQDDAQNLKVINPALREMQTILINEFLGLLKQLPGDVYSGTFGKPNPNKSLASDLLGVDSLPGDNVTFQNVIDSIANFFNSFASIPQAYASGAGGQMVGPPRPSPSPIDTFATQGKLPPGSHNQQNLDKINQEIINARQHTQKTTHEIISGTQQGAKPKAGQTQKNERYRLIQLISKITANIKKIQTDPAWQKKSPYVNAVRNLSNQLAQSQRELQALLNRYSW